MKGYWDNLEEIFIGAVLQFPLYFIVGWWVVAIMATCAILWRLGGTKGGSKLFRRVGAPLLVCGSTFLFEHNWAIFLAIPFMVWIAPSYGDDSWLHKRLPDNFFTRIITYTWYWAAFSLARAL